MTSLDDGVEGNECYCDRLRHMLGGLFNSLDLFTIFTVHNAV